MTESSSPARDTAPASPGGGPDGGALATRLEPSARRALVLLLVAVFVVFLNETTMTVAIPTIIADLRITPAQGQWLTTAFALTMAVVIPVTGWLLQRLNTRPVYITGLSVFTAGTLVAAIAPAFEVLVAGRVIQAAGTAIMMPLMMTTSMSIVPMHLRGRVMGRISIVMALAPALGPTVAGLLLRVFDDQWRALFVVMLPLAVAALVLGVVLIPNVSETRRVPLDVPSVILSAVGFSAAVYGLSSIARAAEGVHDVPPALALGIGGAALAGLVIRQLVLQRRDAAFLDLRVFAVRNYLLSVLIFSLAMLTMFGLILVLPIYLQYVLLLEPAVIGALLLPGSLLQGVLGPTVGRIYDRVGPRPLVIPGSILVSIAAWGLALLLTTETPIWLIAATHVVLSLGFACLFPPLFASGLGSLPPHLYSHGSAIVSTIQQVAGAAGAALYTTLLTIGLAAVGTTDVTRADPQAIVDGGHVAFLTGALISLAIIVVAVLVRRPAMPAAQHGAPAGEVQPAGRPAD